MRTPEDGRPDREIESLSVLPEPAAAGLGSELLQRLETHLHERGVDDLILGALAATPTPSGSRDGAATDPRGSYTSKFAGREPSSRLAAVKRALRQRKLTK